MKKRMTQAEKQRQYIEDVKNKWFEAVKDTEERYTQNEFERGLLWIEIKNMPKGTEYSKTFWNWWKLRMAQAREVIMRSNWEESPKIEQFEPTSSILRQIKDEAQSSIA